ncbi:hypothetical protein V9T40_005348 [Parthenolecanium corni]|uniref:SET domain-containing protein n=1 Tax=Parthenolecanium corni TaxID=536013 RepID=A0AAN9TGQ5_9HEMI
MEHLQQIIDSFCDSLEMTMGGAILGSTGADLLMRSPEELIPIVYNLLAKAQRFPIIGVRVSKNREEAEEYFVLATNVSEIEDDVTAINYYTICIAVAVPDSPLLYLAYADRSASLYRLARFSACLMDVNRALKGAICLDPELICSLHERKRICIIELKKEKAIRREKEKVMPEFESEVVEKKAGEGKDDECHKKESTISEAEKKKLKRLRKLNARKQQSMAEMTAEGSRVEHDDSFSSSAADEPAEDATKKSSSSSSSAANQPRKGAVKKSSSSSSAADQPGKGATKTSSSSSIAADQPGKSTTKKSSSSSSSAADQPGKGATKKSPSSSSSAVDKPKKSASKKSSLKAESSADEIDEGMTSPDNDGKFPLPHIANPNELVPSASAKVKIDFSQTYGRHLIATEDIKPGEVLLVEHPFASVLMPHFYHTTCRYCFVRCEALISCPKCLLGTFCSEKCLSRAFDEFHRVECPILLTLMKLEIAGDAHLAIRLFLVATKQGANLKSMMQHLVFKSPLEIHLGPIKGQYFAEDYINVHNLMDNHGKLTALNLFRKCCEAVVLLFVLKHTTFFSKSEEDTSEVDMENLTEEEVYAGMLLLKFLLLSTCNSRSVVDMVEKPKAKAEDEEYYHLSQIGYALYPVHSLMNHSCDPNTFSVNHKDSIVCYAIQPIKKGDQIFTFYNWTYTRFDKMFRTNRLLFEYFFTCQCDACKFDWGQKLFYTNAKLKRISNKITEKELKEYERKFKMYTSKEGLRSSTQNDLDFLIDVVSVYSKCVKLPCQTHIEASECMTFILAKRGNTYENGEDFVLCKLAFSRGNRD